VENYYYYCCYYYYYLLYFYTLSLNISHCLQWLETDKLGKTFSLIHYIYLSWGFMKKILKIQKKISKYCSFSFESDSFVM